MRSGRHERQGCGCRTVQYCLVGTTVSKREPGLGLLDGLCFGFGVGVVCCGLVCCDVREDQDQDQDQGNKGR